MNNKNDVQRQISTTNQKPQHPSLPPKPTFDRFNKENYYNPFNTPNNENSRPSIHQTSNTPTNLIADGEHIKSTGMQYVKHSQQLHPFQVVMDLNRVYSKIENHFSFLAVHVHEILPFLQKTITTALDTSFASNHSHERNINSLKIRKNSQNADTTIQPLSSSASQYNLDYDPKDKINIRSKNRFLSGSRSQLIAQR